MAGVTLDTGALIQADRGDERVWRYLRILAREAGQLTVPAPVLAQAWRGARNAQLAMALRGATIEPLDEFMARRVGELCARARTSDIVDATVVISASLRGDTIVTSDPRDILHLASFVSTRLAVVDVTRLRPRN